MLTKQGGRWRHIDLHVSTLVGIYGPNHATVDHSWNLVQSKRVYSGIFSYTHRSQEPSSEMETGYHLRIDCLDADAPCSEDGRILTKDDFLEDIQYLFD